MKEQAARGSRASAGSATDSESDHSGHSLDIFMAGLNLNGGADGRPEPERRRPEPGGGSPTLRDTPPKHVRFEGVQGAGRALRNQRQARKAERRQE